MQALSLTNLKQRYSHNGCFYTKHNHHLYALILTVLCIGLSACGFQLRGIESATKLPDKVIISADSRRLQNAIINQLAAVNVHVIDAQEPHELLPKLNEQPPVTPTLLLTETANAKQSLLLDNQGNTSQWQLSLSTTLSIMHQQSSQPIILTEYQQVTIGSDINASNSEIEARVWQNLHQKLAQRIVQALRQALP